MNVIYDNQERDRMIEARESFSGRTLTDSQFEEAIAITGIMEREIQKTGTFKEKLGDYSHAFARTEKFDAFKAEETIRDLFKIRTGQTMNQMRKNFLKQEACIFNREKSSDGSAPSLRTDAKRTTNLSDNERKKVLSAASETFRTIAENTRMSFYRATTHQASQLSQELGITQVGAKRLMSQLFKETENKEFYDSGKALEEKHYRPHIEAERKNSEQQRFENPGRKLSMSR